MVITIAIVGPADVQDEWGMKLGLFLASEHCHAIFTHFPSTTLHSFMMFSMLILDSYASYADDYQPSIPDSFHLIWIYMICVTIANSTSFRFLPIPFSSPISVCTIRFIQCWIPYLSLSQQFRRFFVAQWIPCTFGKFKMKVVRHRSQVSK